MVIAVTLCLLMLFMLISEYFRVNIIVQGVRDAVQQAVIATVHEHYDDVYHSVRAVSYTHLDVYKRQGHVSHPQYETYNL